MELVRRANELLRVLLTLAALQGLQSVFAHATTLPEIDVNTLLDDEDLTINNKRASVQLAVDLQSNAYCLQEKYLTVVMNHIRMKLLHDLDVECKCLQGLDDIITEENIECGVSNLIKYSAKIPNWSSTSFDVLKLSQFLGSWKAVVTVNGGDVDFTTIQDFKFVYNVTGTTVLVVTEESSGDGPTINVDDIDLGSGGDDMGTIESIVDENETGGVNEGVIPIGLDGTSRGESVRVVGAVVTLSVVLATVLSFVTL